MKITKKILFTIPVVAMPIVIAVSCGANSGNGDGEKKPGTPIAPVDINTKFIDNIKNFDNLKQQITTKYLVQNFDTYKGTNDANKDYIVLTTQLYKTILNETLDSNESESSGNESDEINKTVGSFEKSFNDVVAELSKEKTEQTKVNFYKKFFVNANAVGDQSLFEELQNVLRDFNEQLQQGRYSLGSNEHSLKWKILTDVLPKLEKKVTVADADIEVALREAYLYTIRYFVSPEEFEHDKEDHNNTSNSDADTSKHSHSHAIFNMLKTAFHESNEFAERFDNLEIEMKAITSWTDTEKTTLNSFITQIKAFKTQISTNEPLIDNFIKNKVVKHYDLMKKELEAMIELNKLNKATILAPR